MGETLEVCRHNNGHWYLELIGYKQREGNKTIEVVESQLNAVSERTKDWENIVIAYEPVWFARLLIIIIF